MNSRDKRTPRRSIGRSRNRRHVRRAMLLISLLISLGIVMALVASWMRTIALEQRHVRATADRVQAEYLAASGVQRAAAQLAINPEYAGETWRIDGESLDMRAGASVVIKIASSADNPRSHRVTVEASFPAEGPEPARRTQEVVIEPAAR